MNLYFVSRKKDEGNKDDEYLIKGIVSEIIENEESQIYKLLNKSDQTVKDFIEKTGEIKSSITGVDQQTRNLISVLNNNQSRGQWAEFQVEDLLGIMEYKDGIHYETQKIMKSGTKPDFTFYLPDNKTINMDSKFPLTNYMEIAKLNRNLDDETLDQISRKEINDLIKNKNKEFLDKAIKTKIDETSSREGYISSEEGTVDFVLMYIPLENLYHFLLTSVIGSNKTPVIQYAFSKKVILVSPQTLMAYLETIRHSMKLFSLQTDTKNILITHEKVKNEVRKFIDSFDDVTKLVSAQRSAAWGDVARRIAHEIKNPLTPIQLSAERIRRKFGPLLKDEEQGLTQMVNVITRQTDDLRRIVDEFSKFARMPELKRKDEDLNEIVGSIITLQQAGQPNVTINFSKPKSPIIISIDATLINQAITNILKNAGEAIEARNQKTSLSSEAGIIKVVLKDEAESVVIQISDNGIGLPQDRSRLFEPYVTTRNKGTGLGLAIVKKIIEEHGGILKLEDAIPFDNSGIVGALISIDLPKSKKIMEKIGSKN